MRWKANDVTFPMNLVPLSESLRRFLNRQNKPSGAATLFWATLGLVSISGLKPRFRAKLSETLGL
jgi:hypothetical protein